MPESEEKPAPPSLSTQPANPSAKKLIIIDDDPTTSKMAKELLLRAGYIVTSAKNVKSAWLAMTPDNMPNLIITDLMMPEIDGFALLRELKSNVETQNIPVLVISGHKQMEDTVLWAGADAFLNKPFTDEELLRTVQETITFLK